MNRGSIYKFSMSLLVGTAISCPVMAQISGDTAGVEEITVTARRAQESLTDVPIAITALTGDALDARGITDIQDLAAFTPGFRFQNQSVGRNDRGFKQYNMRGMVPNNASSIRQNVTIFVDGAPVSGGNVSGVTDVERVEVVKGPQSAFFGRGTFAGAVNFITRAPGYEWGGDINAQYERFNTYDLTASVEGPIVADKLSFRVSGRAYHTDGQYRDAVYTDARLGRRNTKSISLSLLAEPTDTLKLRFFSVVWNDSDGLPANARYGVEQYNCNAGAAPAGTNNYICGKLGRVPMGTATWAQYLDPTAYAGLTRGAYVLSPTFIDHLGLERDAQQYRLAADWELGDFIVSALGSYSMNKWAFLQTPFGADLRNVPNISYTPGSGRLPYVYSTTQGQTRDEDKYIELRVQSPADKPLKALFGVNYQKLEYDHATTAFGATGYVVATPRGLSVADTYSAFASVSYDFLNSFSIAAEGRYQIDKQSQTTFAANTTRLANTFKAFTPRVIVQYKPDDRSSVYASYSMGNRAGAFNAVYFAQSAFVREQIDRAGAVQGIIPEEKLWMGEIGYKSQLFDNRLRVLAAAYYGKWTDRGIPSTIPIFTDPLAAQTGTTNGTVVITAPGGRVEVKGFELELAYRANDNLTLEATYNVADTRILRTFSSDSAALTGNGSPVGTQLPFYPKVTATGSFTYNQPIGDLNAYVRGDMIYTGRQYETESNLAYTAPAATVNLRVGVDFDGKRIELFGTNIFDNRTPSNLARSTYATYSPTGAGTNRNGITVSLADRASYGVRVSTKF